MVAAAAAASRQNSVAQPLLATGRSAAGGGGDAGHRAELRRDKQAKLVKQRQFPGRRLSQTAFLDALINSHRRVDVPVGAPPTTISFQQTG